MDKLPKIEVVKSDPIKPIPYLCERFDAARNRAGKNQKPVEIPYPLSLRQRKA